jgi:hypothetical protein
MSWYAELQSTNALMGLVWTVYHFCTMLSKVHRLHLKICKNGQMSWDAELQRKSRKILEGLENAQFGILISQHHIPGTASGHGSQTI